MRIVMNGLAAKQGGAQTVLLNMIRYSGSQHEILILVGSYNRNRFEPEVLQHSNCRIVDCGSRVKNSFYRTLWERYVLPHKLEKWNADVLFSSSGFTLIRPLKDCKSVMSVCNMLIFDKRERKRLPFFSLVRMKAAIRRFLVLYALKRSDKIRFISIFSHDCVCDICPEVNNKSCVIPNGLNENFLRPSALEFNFSKFGLREGQFYLYVSILDYYKAQLELIYEWKKLIEKGFQYPLVLTGFLTRKGYVDKVKRAIAELRLEKHVIITGPVKYEDLPAYYAGARALVFASSCECCPNILLEKMSAGKPIFCSNYPPMPEFGGPDAYYFDPYIRGDLSRIILEAEQNDSEMLRRAKMLRKRAAQYNWDKNVRETMKFITDF